MGTFKSGLKVEFACLTVGAQSHYVINDKDMATDVLNEEGKFSFLAAGGVASYAVSEKMVFAKIGMDIIKVLMK